MKRHYIQPKAVVISLYKDYDILPSLMSGSVTVGFATEDDNPEGITPMGKALYDEE